jgi:hypothetical protein
LREPEAGKDAIHRAQLRCAAHATTKNNKAKQRYAQKNSGAAKIPNWLVIPPGVTL